MNTPPIYPPPVNPADRLRRRYSLAAAAAFLAAGVSLGLAIGVAAIPDQPDRILVPVGVEQPVGPPPTLGA